MSNKPRILLISATYLEVREFLTHLRLSDLLQVSTEPGLGVATRLASSNVVELDLLVTGVGQLQAAASISACLSCTRYDLCIQAGLCGSFTPSIQKLTAVRIVSEAIADLGAEDPQKDFIDLFDMQLLQPNSAPFHQKLLHEDRGDDSKVDGLIGSLMQLPAVSSVTVNRVLSHDRSILWVRERFAADVVNMEGAALFYVCNRLRVPAVQIRVVSDFVGPRDKSAWDLPGGVRRLGEILAVWWDGLNSNVGGSRLA